MIEVFDNFLSEEQINRLFVALNKTYWILEMDLPYPNGLAVKGGAKHQYVNLKEEKRDIFQEILEQLTKLSVIDNEYVCFSCLRNAYKSDDVMGVHTDEDEGDITALVYGNPEWNINWGGETIFTDKQSIDSDIVASVIPKPGRLVLFDSKIPHCGRPPSSSYPYHRYSVAYFFKKK